MKRFKKLFLFIFLCPFITLTGMGQTIIKGKVEDAVSRQGLDQVRISMMDNSYETLTDTYGNFQLITLTSPANVWISAAGFKSVGIELAQDSENIIKLVADLISLKEIRLQSTTNANKFSILNKIDLGLNPVRSSQELLRLAPGLMVAQHAGGGKAEQIFLRGFDADHGTDVSVNVDGMPVNMVSHAHGQGYADAHFIIAETVNNIDFGAGPYYAGYGNFTTAGYINLSTFNNIDKSRIQLEAGGFNSYRSLVMLDLLKKNKDKQSAYIAAEINYSDGPTENKQHFNRVNLFGKYNRAFSEKTQLTTSLSAFKSKWDASGQIPGRAINSGVISRFGSIDPTEGGATERYNANIILNKNISNKLQWENQLYYSRYLFNLYSNFTFFLDDPVNGDGIQQKETRDLFGFITKLSNKYYIRSWLSKTLYSAGIRYDVTTNSSLNNQVKRKFISHIQLGDIKEANLFGYIQQQYTNKKWAVDAAIRLDYFHSAYSDKLVAAQLPSRDAAILSPKLNIQYTVSQQVQLYLKTGKGFHSNDSRLVVANKGREILPAAYGTDVGIILKPVKQLLLNIATWYLQLDQEFVYVGDAGIVEPGGATKRYGIDLAARYQLTGHLFAKVNLNLAKAKVIGVKKGENHVPLAPDATSTGGLFYRSFKGWNGGISYRYIKNRPANEDNSIVAMGYFITDASVNYTKAKYEAGISIENMMNVKWNEAQFATTSRLQHEADPVNEIHFTAGNPFFAKLKLAVFF